MSQVLGRTSSSSNTTIPDSVTQVVSESNLSSRSNVSSAVERARSKLQRSRSTGLCSRFSQRERLRSASSSVPSKTTEERNNKLHQNNLNSLNLLLCTWGKPTAKKKICQLTTTIFCFEDLLIAPAGISPRGEIPRRHPSSSRVY